MTLEELLATHEAERRRVVDRLSTSAAARVDAAYARFEHQAKVAWSAWGAATFAATLGALFAREVEPTIAAVEASMAAAVAGLAEVGKRQAEEEATQAEAEATSMVPVVGAAAAVVLVAGLRTAFERVRSQAMEAIAGPGPGSHLDHLVLLADLRQAASAHVKLVAVTEASRSLSAGALAAIRTYSGVDAYWRAEANPCPICADLAGSLIDVGTGIPPAHPNCRCSTVPWPSGKRVPAGVASA